MRIQGMNNCVHKTELTREEDTNGVKPNGQIFRSGIRNVTKPLFEEMDINKKTEI